MPTFVTNVVTAIATQTETFATALVTDYWAYILGIAVLVYLSKKFLGAGTLGIAKA